MDREKKSSCGPDEWTSLTRRDFIKGVGIGGGAVVLLGQFGVRAAAWALSGDHELKMVLADSSATKAGIPHASNSLFAIPASYGAPKTATVTSFSVILFLDSPFRISG